MGDKDIGAPKINTNYFCCFQFGPFFYITIAIFDFSLLLLIKLSIFIFYILCLIFGIFLSLLLFLLSRKQKLFFFSLFKAIAIYFLFFIVSSVRARKFNNFGNSMGSNKEKKWYSNIKNDTNTWSKEIKIDNFTFAMLR